MLQINFLKKRNRFYRRINKFAQVIIGVSLVLLLYPFWGMVEYWVVPISQATNTASQVTDIKPILTQTILSLAPQNPKLQLMAIGVEQLPNIIKTIKIAAENKPASAVSAPVIASNQKIATSVQISKTVTQPAKPATKVAVAPKTTAAEIKKTPVNMLYIPDIKVEMKIVEGKTEKALYQGAWRLPGTSEPDLGGNTVIGGHRWLYKPPSKRTFYNLDKVEVGDKIIIDWEGQRYNYFVREIKVVEPKDVEILNNTGESIITLFTCTPLYTSKNRLVVIGELIN